MFRIWALHVALLPWGELVIGGPLSIGNANDDAWLSVDADAETVPSHCHTSTPLDFSGAHIVYNNLGGLGPGTGDPVIEYGNVGKLSSGNPISMVVSNLSSYAVEKTRRFAYYQGLSSAVFGSINVADGSSVKLKFRFIDGVTRHPAQLDNIILTFFDLDETSELRKVSLSTCGASAYYLSETAKPPVASTVKVLADHPKLFCTEFRSLVRGGLDDAPAAPDTLSATQKSKSVSLQYVRSSEIDLTFSVAGEVDLRSGRYLLFAGASTVDGCLPPGTSTSTMTSTVTTSTNTDVTSTSSTFTTTTRTWTSTTSVTPSSTKTHSTTTVTTTTVSTTTSTTTTPPPLQLWNCLNQDVASWTPDKRDWCCLHEQLGCSGSQSQSIGSPPAKAFNCVEGLQVDWSPDKRSYCCTYLQIGCGTSNVVQSTPMPTQFQAAPTTLSDRIWDCNNGLAGSWIREKREWCCKNEQRGCGSNVFDCQTGQNNWEAEWSRAKKNWCCTHETIGCESQLKMRIGNKFEMRHHKSTMTQSSHTYAVALVAGIATFGVAGVALFSFLKAQRVSSPGYSMVLDSGSGIASGPDF